MISQEEVRCWPEANPGWHPTLAVARGMGKRRHQVGPILATLAARGDIRRRLLGKGPKVGLEWSV